MNKLIYVQNYKITWFLRFNFVIGHRNQMFNWLLLNYFISINVKFISNITVIVLYKLGIITVFSYILNI